MCSNLLDELHGVQQELRNTKWSQDRDTSLNIIRILFQSGGNQIRDIIETLNLMGMLVPTKALEVKQVAKDIVAAQQTKGFLTLVDLKEILSSVMAQSEATLLEQMVDNSKNLFGTPAESVQFEPADLTALDGTFNTEFSTSLLLNNPNITTEVVHPRPIATSSTTAVQSTRNDVFGRMESVNPSFAAKLKLFREPK